MIKDELITLNNRINSCSKCDLNCYKTKAIIARASPKVSTPVSILVIAEAGGAEEFEQKKVLVGRSGKLVDQWLTLINPENFVLTNIVKNRPVDENGSNRKPTQEEIDACLPYLYEQIRLLKPKTILLLGDTALKALIKTENTITESVEKEIEYNFQGIRTFAFYHPAYILRNMNSNWQEQIESLAKKITNKEILSGERLYKEAGIKSSEEALELKMVKLVEDKSKDLPIIGLHSDYSIMNYGGKLIDTVIFLKKYGAKTIGYSDINNTGEFLRLDSANKLDIKVIYGSELSKDNYGFALYIKNDNGFKNLNKIVSMTNNEPDFDLFKETISNKEGLKLIILPKYFKIDDVDKYKMLIDAFGDDAYVGFIPTDNIREKIKFNYIRDKFSLKPVIYQDNLFDDDDKYEIYCSIEAIKNRKTLKEMISSRKNIDKKIKFEDDIKILLKDDYEYFKQSTIDFVNNINFKIKRHHNLMPNITNLNVEDKNKYFENLVRSKDLSFAINKYCNNNNISIEDGKKIYDDRIEHELEIIKLRNFVDYFLIVKDICEFARNNNIPKGNLRGSAGGSIVSYCLGIIDTDPINDGLFFERFINEYKETLPDIDVDFSKNGRKEIINYLKEKYGAKNVVSCGTYLVFKEKSALNYLAKITETPKYIVDEINSKLVKRSSGDARTGHILEETFKFYPELLKYKDKFPKFFELLPKIEGIIHTAGTHASGIMLLPDEYYNYFSTIKAGEEVMSIVYGEAEGIGLLKLDILGLNTLDIIKETLESVGKSIKDLNYDDPDNNKTFRNDQKVFDCFVEGRTAGVFQAQTDAFTSIGTKLVKDSFTDIVVLNSVVRPAGLRYGLPKKYIDFKNNGTITTIHPLIDNKFKEVGGIVMWQEQIMLIFQHIFGYYLVDTNQIIKAISKSKGIITMESYRQKAVEGALKNGLTEEEANKLFDSVCSFGSFCYNKSHATGYAYLMYYTAWLKVHYPFEFYCACLNNMEGDKKTRVIKEMEKIGIKIVHPDINKSDKNKFLPDKINNTTIIPLSEIKYLTTKNINEIIAKRPYVDLDDLFSKVKISNNAKNSLIIDTIEPKNLKDILIKVEASKTRTIQEYKEKIKEEINKIIKVNLNTINDSIKLRKECDVLCVSTNPKLANYGDWLPIKEKPTKEMIEKEPEKYSFLKKYKWMAKWCKLSIVDLNDIEVYSNINPDIYEIYSERISRIKNGSLVIVRIKTGAKLMARGTIKKIALVDDLINKREDYNEYEKYLLGIN